MGKHSAETKSQRPDLLQRVATRYDKLAANYLAFIKLASIRIWPRANESAP
jgi:transposase